MRLLALIAGLLAIPATSAPAQLASIVVRDARIWTADSSRPWASAVAIAGDRILAVGNPVDLARHIGPGTRVVRAPGRLITPGFIDNHTHFNSAGALLLGVNLLDVADAPSLIRRVREAAARLTPGAWMLGGDWGAYEAWAMNSSGADRSGRDPFRPTRDLIDSLTPDTPALLARWDRTAYLANGKALAVAGIGCGPEGVECRDGVPTGRLTPAAAERVRAAIGPKSLDQRLAEARLALAELRQFGVTTIHDITPPEQFEVYQELRRRGELTTRVFARPTLDKIGELRALGIKPGFGDEWIKIGGLKGFVDGIMGNSSARFYQPYLTSGKLGEWRTMMEPPGNMERLLFSADSAGYWPMVHAIGDHGIDTLLTLFDRVITTNGAKPRRFRMIHAQVLRDGSVADRMARLGIVAEVQPYHAIDDMRWMEERIGGRARWAYAFRTLERAGVLLSFGSDWPGTNASWYPTNPMMGIYAAVNRQTLDGKPAAGWFPEERVSIETALRAYTVNNAWAGGEEAIKGRIAPGYLADLVVLDRDIFRIPPAEIKDVQARLVIVGGRVVQERR
ncbi:MAG: amidohydrolase [Gemmatimonadetes bacterium]|nr:amidohydrolase [Gemmatimonadota bacterium]